MVFSTQEELFFFGTSNGDILVKNLDWDYTETWAAHEHGVEYLLCIEGTCEIPVREDRLVSFGNDGSILIWDICKDLLVPTKAIHGFHCAFKPCLVACRPLDRFNPDMVKKIHHFLVFATEDGALNWWDIDDNTSHATVIDGVGTITTLDIHETEDLVAVGTADGKVKIWRMSTLAYVLQASVEGIVTRVRFLYDKFGDRYFGDRLAVTTSHEENLQIWRFDKNLQQAAPVSVWNVGSYHGQIFDIYTARNQSVLVVFRNGNFQIAYPDGTINGSPPSLELSRIKDASGKDNVCASLSLIANDRILVYCTCTNGTFSVKPSREGEGWQCPGTITIMTLQHMPIVCVEGTQIQMFSQATAVLQNIDVHVEKNPQEPNPGIESGNHSENTKLLSIAKPPEDFAKQLQTVYDIQPSTFHPSVLTWL